MSYRKRILIVEDEPAIAGVIQDYLNRSGMDAEIVRNGRHAVETIVETKPDLVVLDVMLPGKDGLTICREVRAKSNVPIILQTARVEEVDRLLGLELGADDYICKPFSPRELVARVKTVLRRTNGEAFGSEHSLALDSEKWLAEVNGVSIDLTRREFQILQILVNRPGRVYSRSQLLDLVFPDDMAVFDRTVDSHIKNIRSKFRTAAIGWDPIRSVYGVGYAFDD